MVPQVQLLTQSVAPPSVSNEVANLQNANQQLNDAVMQLKQQLQLANMGLEVATEFSQGQHQLINLLSTFVMGETATRELSEGQDKLIEFLADLLSDADYLLYWAFEIWHQAKPSPQFMEILSDAYLKLSEMHPPQNQPSNEQSALNRIAQGQQSVNQMYANPLQPAQTVPVQVGIQPSNELMQLSQMAAAQQQQQQQLQGFMRPSVPAPPIPSQNGNGNGWNGVRQNMQSGNTLQALREVGQLSATDWREMFSTQN